MPEQSLVADDKFKICVAIGLKVDDHEAGPFAIDIGETLAEKCLASRNRAEMPDLRRPMGEQHPGQQMGGMPVIIDQGDERQIVGYLVQAVTSSPAAGRYTTKPPLFERCGALGRSCIRFVKLAGGA